MRTKSSPPANGPQTITLKSVEPYVQSLLDWFRKHTDSPLQLDWRKLRHIEAPAASILSQALLKPLGSFPIVLRPPEQSHRLEVLFRSGLLFALANREGETRVEGPLGGRPTNKWRQGWVPGDLASIRALFDPAGHPPGQDQLFDDADFQLPDLFGRYHAAFINPHRLPIREGSDHLTAVVKPWLSEVLPNLAGKTPRSQGRAAFLDQIRTIIDELLQNVREHAHRTREGKPTQSLLQVVVTLGGGSQSYNRVYLSVQDTGPGIVETARPKLQYSSRPNVPDEQFLLELFQGSFKSWDRGRGKGLPRVWEICKLTPRASLWVASRANRLVGDKSSLVTSAGFDIDGSVIVAMLPEPPILSE